MTTSPSPEASGSPSSSNGASGASLQAYLRPSARAGGGWSAPVAISLAFAAVYCLDCLTPFDLNFFPHYLLSISLTFYIFSSSLAYLSRQSWFRPHCWPHLLSSLNPPPGMSREHLDLSLHHLVAQPLEPSYVNEAMILAIAALAAEPVRPANLLSTSSTLTLSAVEAHELTQ